VQHSKFCARNVVMGHSQQRQRAPKIHRCPLCSESDGQPSKRDLSQWAISRPRGLSATNPFITQY
jgi:hypothetical protein